MQNLEVFDEARWQTALKSFDNADWKEAEFVFEQFLEKDKNHVPTRFYLGLIALRTMRFPKAIREFSRVVQVAPTYAEAYNNLGNAQAMSGDLESASMSFSHALKINPDDARARNNLGNTLRDRGKLREALFEYERALELKADYAEAWNNKGIVHSRLNEVDQSAACYRRALELDDRNCEAHNNMGVALARLGQLENAISCFQKSLALKSNYCDALNNLGLTQIQLGDLDNAESSFREITRIAQNYHKAYINLGKIADAKQKFDSAIMQYEQALYFEPDSLEAHFGKGRAHLNACQYQEAVKHLDKSLHLSNGDPSIHCNLASAFRHLHEINRATSHVDAALTVLPDSTDFIREKALICLSSGNYEKGWKFYASSCVLDLVKGVPWDGREFDGILSVYCLDVNVDDFILLSRYIKEVQNRDFTVELIVSDQMIPIAKFLGFDSVSRSATDNSKSVDLRALPQYFKDRTKKVPEIGDLKESVLLKVNEKVRNSTSAAIAILRIGKNREQIQRIELNSRYVDKLQQECGVRIVEISYEFVEKLELLKTGASRSVVQTCLTRLIRQISEVDLIICPDSIVAHIAAMLGKPVWLILGHVCDWRWLIKRRDSPWFPTVSIYRIGQNQEIGDTINEIVSDLKIWLAGRKVTRTDTDLLVRGKECFSNDDLEEAAIYLREYVVQNPNSTEGIAVLGSTLLKLGRFDEAESYLLRAVADLTHDSELYTSLAKLYLEVRQDDKSQQYCSLALENQPENWQAQNIAGLLRERANDPKNAIECFQQAIANNEKFTEAYYNLGRLFAQTGDKRSSLMSFRKANELEPDNALVLNNLGNVLRELGQIDDSIECFEKAIETRPDFWEAFNNIGIAYSRQSKYDKAIECFKQAIALKTNYAAAHNNMGIALANEGDKKAALACYREAIRLEPKYAEAFNNLAIVQTHEGFYDEAIRNYYHALELKPEYPEAHNNLGISLSECRKTKEALEHYGIALEQRSDYPDAHMNRALTYLAAGMFDIGWKEYEWRWQCPSFNKRHFDKPRWQGESDQSFTILLHTEQGFGDTFQFIRYAKLVKDRGHRVVLRCPKPLIKILSSCNFIDGFVVEGEPLPKDYDFHFELLSMPYLFGTLVETIPVEIPYIHADPNLVEKWEIELSHIRAFKIGINWQGNKQYRGDSRRSIALAHFGELATIPGVRLISMQRGFGIEQVQNARFALTTLGADIDTAHGSFMDTAAILKNLDLLVTSDTSLAHLAGALGVEVWVPLAYSPDWRWMLTGLSCPWYPSMRLFRQTSFDSWPSVFGRMREEIGKRMICNEKRIVAEISAGELIDKITILEIKIDKMRDPAQLANIHKELAILNQEWTGISKNEDVLKLRDELRRANEELWEIEDKIRIKEKDSDFGPDFVELARSVYKTNDLRSELKRQLNIILNSRIVEEKSYQDYGLKGQGKPPTR